MLTRGVELRQLTKVHPGFQLGPLSCRFLPGHSYGLVGPNGAGKTTLLDVISLQARASGGEVRSNGVPIRWGQAGWKERISYVRENPAFYGDLTVAATLRLASRLYRTWNEGFATNQLSRLGLAPDQHVKHLSKGSAVKLGILTALAHRAEFLILDEPTSGLDPTARAEIHETLWNLRQEQAPLMLLFSSHVLDDVGQVADEVIVLRNGASVFKGAVRELATLEVFRLPDTADLAASELKKSPDARLVWRTDRCLRVAVPQGSALAAALAKRPDVVEETTGMTLPALYERTALAC